MKLTAKGNFLVEFFGWFFVGIWNEILKVPLTNDNFLKMSKFCGLYDFLRFSF